MTSSKLRLIWIVLFALVLSGCVGGSSGIFAPAPDWSVKVDSFETRTWISSDISGYGYSPDPGYTWLLFHLQMSNLLNRPQDINWYMSSFDFVSDGNHYGIHLAYNDPPGYIDTYFNPKQTKTGYIVFEVPIGTNPRNDKLVWDPYEGDDIVLDLSSVPQTP